MVNKVLLEEKLEAIIKTSITSYCEKKGVRIVEAGECYSIPRKIVVQYYNTREEWANLEKSKQLFRLRNYCMYHNAKKYFKYYTKLKGQL